MPIRLFGTYTTIAYNSTSTDTMPAISATCIQLNVNQVMTSILLSLWIYGPPARTAPHPAKAQAGSDNNVDSVYRRRRRSRRNVRNGTASSGIVREEKESAARRCEFWRGADRPLVGVN